MILTPVFAVAILVISSPALRTVRTSYVNRGSRDRKVTYWALIGRVHKRRGASSLTRKGSEARKGST